jgi:serine protease Do
MLRLVKAPHLCRLLGRAASGVWLALLLVSKPSIAGPLAPLPGSPSQPSQAAAQPSDASGLEHVSRGVVTLERDGRLLGVGTVLAADGRVLTALSALGPSDYCDVRYSDGSLVHARVGHRDKSWDLALLVPLSGKWTEGLRASEVDPATTELRALVATHPGRPTIVPAHLRGTVDARAKEGSDALANALDIELHGGGGPTVGAPLMDSAGGVVGVLVRVCKVTLPAAGPNGAPTPAPATSPCSPLLVAAPVASIRHFLAHTPLNAVAPSAWLGIVGAPDSTGNTHGVRVMAVAPQSPAEKGGLKANTDHAQADLIVAVDSQPVDTPEKLADFISKHPVGEHVKLLVLTGEKFREVLVTLHAAP